MMGQALAWWVASTLAGLSVFPLTWRVLHRLPDRGWGLTRALGLLLSGYVLWLGASTGLLHNDAAGAVAAMVAALLAGLLAGRGRWPEIARWVREHVRLLIAEEAVFTISFAVWVLVRATNPEIVATEKPMELAFLNAILRSPNFPPQDPWLSGYAISYYYFGYVLLSLLTTWTGVSAGVAFNLGSALWFGLTAVGTYSLTLNLLAAHGERPRPWAALLGPVVILFVGNAAGLFEILHSLHVFWRPGPDGTLTSTFWSWLNLKDLVLPPAGPPDFPPERFWFWWQGARVINDINLAGLHVEVIDEFPLFSFLLADNHPHVLALPFAILAIGYALHAYLGAKGTAVRLSFLRLPESWPTGAAIAGIVTSLIVGLARGAAASLQGAPFTDAALRALQGILLVGAGWAAIGVALALLAGAWEIPLGIGEVLFAGWVFGALAFLNTWDFPIYLLLLLLALGMGFAGQPVRRTLGVLGSGAAAVGMGAMILYFPWFPTFASQAGGVLPNLIFPTRLPQFLIFFATSFVPIGVWLFLQVRANASPSDRKSIIGWGLGLPLGLWVLSIAYGLIILVVKPLEATTSIQALGATSMADLFQAALVRRGQNSWVALLLGLVAAGAFVLLRRRASERTAEGAAGSAMPFVLFLIGLGALLVLGPEFFYLEDSFGSRMNTVFKLFYAGWLLWGLATAYLLATPWPGRRGSGWAALATLPLVVGFLYTFPAIWNKTNEFRPPLGLNLDGTAHLALDDPPDYDAILWINANLPGGVLAEAAGGSYSQYGRISAHTGLSSVLGWDFHEYQWRGSYEPQGSRQGDIERLYLTRDWEDARVILDQYGIRYVYLGPLERSTYGPVQTRKFDIYMETIYTSDDVTIYARAGGVSR
jgi:uncharacterized membrane protein